MHHPRWLIVAILVAGLTVAALDLAAARWIDVRIGSVGIAPWADGLDIVANPDCQESDSADEPCALRYAFRPSAVVTAWISVRNAGPIPVTLGGASQAWMERYADVEPLAKPVLGLDGGDPHRLGGLGIIHPAPSEPLILDPGAERLVGVEFAVTDDLGHACEHWVDGGAVHWASVQLTWHWVVVPQEQELALDPPIEFAAPTSDDCA